MAELPPNPFFSSAASDAVAGTAVALEQPQAPGAAANQSSMATGGPKEDPAVDEGSAVAGLLDDDNRFDRHFDEIAFMIEIAERPFFLQAAQ